MTTNTEDILYLNGVEITKDDISSIIAREIDLTSDQINKNRIDYHIEFCKNKIEEARETQLKLREDALKLKEEFNEKRESFYKRLCWLTEFNDKKDTERIIKEFVILASKPFIEKKCEIESLMLALRIEEYTRSIIISCLVEESSGYTDTKAIH